MLGGLLYELLTAGHPPYHWLLYDTDLLRARFELESPACVTGPETVGLKGTNVLEAACIDGVPIPWSVQGIPAPDADASFLEAKEIMTVCFQKEPTARPTMDGLAVALEELSGKLLASNAATGAVYDSIQVRSLAFSADLGARTVLLTVQVVYRRSKRLFVFFFFFQVFKLLTKHGVSEVVAYAVGENVMDHHGDAATLSQVVTLLLSVPDVDPGAALFLQQQVLQVRVSILAGCSSCCSGIV
jgi:hypothetical protein